MKKLDSLLATTAFALVLSGFAGRSDAYDFNDSHFHLTNYIQKDRARIDPMITGFNPTDMYAADHIRRVLLMYPGVFSGIGEFSVHKEFVPAKVAGHTASLLNPALDRILTFAGEADLVVILHNDISTVRPAPDRFLFGSDAVAPKSQADYLNAFDAYQKLWQRLDAETAKKVKAKNFERIFDAARVKVRAWESSHIQN